MDFREAAEAIHQVITFAWSLPHVMNNHRNAECRIWQRETLDQLAEHRPLAGQPQPPAASRERSSSASSSRSSISSRSGTRAGSGPAPAGPPRTGLPPSR